MLMICMTQFFLLFIYATHFIIINQHSYYRVALPIIYLLWYQR